MVAPRSLPGPPETPTPGPSARPPRASDRGRIEALAARWSQLIHDGDPGAAGHFATVLRQLAATVHAEPFWPLAARSVGAQLVPVGACRRPSGLGDEFGDVIVPSLRLLRRDAPAALGLDGRDGDLRLAAVLDELVAGAVGAYRLRQRPAAVPAQGRAPMAVDRHIRAVYEQGAVGIAILALDGQVLDLNPALSGIVGLEGPLDQPRPVSDFVHPDDMVDVVERLQRLVRGEPEVMRLELRLVRADSRVRWVHATASRVLGDDGSPSHLMAVVEDVSDRHRLWSRLHEASFSDQLTRLPNEAVADQWLERAFAGDGPKNVGVCALDLDGFHAIGDELGQQVGDRLLLGVAGRLQLAAGDHVVCRTGADEFAVLVADPVGAAEVSRLADRLQAALATPFRIDNHTLVVSASIGVAEAATAQGSAAELLRAADVARAWVRATIWCTASQPSW